MVDSDEEFEPLFDYTRIQPVDVICFDDDLDESPVFCKKKQKLSDTAEGKKAHDVKVDVKAINLDDKEDAEEDWLAPPPKILDNSCKAIKEDSTLKALRNTLSSISMHLLRGLQGPIVSLPNLRSAIGIRHWIRNFEC